MKLYNLKYKDVKLSYTKIFLFKVKAELNCNFLSILSCNGILRTLQSVTSVVLQFLLTVGKNNRTFR